MQRIGDKDVCVMAIGVVGLNIEMGLKELLG
jgi:hypothetical protein